MPPESGPRFRRSVSCASAARARCFSRIWGGPRVVPIRSTRCSRSCASWKNCSGLRSRSFRTRLRRGGGGDEATPARRRRRGGEYEVLSRRGEERSRALGTLRGAWRFLRRRRFGSAHRAHASTEARRPTSETGGVGVSDAARASIPGRRAPRSRSALVAVLGGAKISGKIISIEALLPIDPSSSAARWPTRSSGRWVWSRNLLVENDRIDLARTHEKGGRQDRVAHAGQRWRRSSRPMPDRVRCLEMRFHRGGPCTISTRRAFVNSRRSRQGWDRIMEWADRRIRDATFDRGTLAIARAMAEATVAARLP